METLNLRPLVLVIAYDTIKTTVVYIHTLASFSDGSSFMYFYVKISFVTIILSIVFNDGSAVLCDVLKNAKNTC